MTHDSLRLVLARAEFKHLLSFASLQATLAEGNRGAREAMGYTVLRFTWAEVHDEPERVAAKVRLHLTRSHPP